MLLLPLLVCIKFVLANGDEIFETDLGDDMNIGLAEGGYKNVKLRCGSNSMHISLETEDDFSGVIYTRGSFHKKNIPCFFDPGYKEGQRSFSVKFKLDECKTKQKGDTYSNVLILQYDKDLIMPGDAAFNLECDFGKPRDVTVNANLNSHPKPVISRISLTSADPNEKKQRIKRSFIESETVVELTPEKANVLNNCS